MGILDEVKARRVPTWLNMAPGFLVVTEFSATGGVKFERKDLKEDEYKITRKADNAYLYKNSKSIIKDRKSVV